MLAPKKEEWLLLHLVRLPACNRNMVRSTLLLIGGLLLPLDFTMLLTSEGESSFMTSLEAESPSSKNEKTSEITGHPNSSSFFLPSGTKFLYTVVCNFMHIITGRFSLQ